MPFRLLRVLSAVLAVAIQASVAWAQLLPPAPAMRCTPATRSTGLASAWLDRAAAAILPPDAAGRILRYRASHDTPFWEQGDRVYEPFLPNTTITERWYDPATGVEGRGPADRPTPPGRRPPQLYSAEGLFAARDSVVMTVPAATAQLRPFSRFNPWLVLRDWRQDSARVRIAERCLDRDAWRVVLARDDERLFLSQSDGVPVKLERTEPHYLWGQVRTEYLWSTYWGVEGGGWYPLAAFRIVDGTTYERVGVIGFQAALVPVDSAPLLSLGTPRPAPLAPASVGPDTIRVSDSTWLLRAPAYTHAVALRRDTLFLFDATTSEERARADSSLIATLFPGRHPMVLVVTDLAWPHVSGVRFWAARGATIAAHATAEPFLRRIFDRRWTLQPDALEAARATAAFRFRPIVDSLPLAGGAVVLHALQNTSTETALGAWLPSDRFLWAGDYVQPSATSPYARDVVRTVRGLGLKPAIVGAQHLPLSDWASLDRRFPEARP